MQSLEQSDGDAGGDGGDDGIGGWDGGLGGGAGDVPCRQRLSVWLSPVSPPELAPLETATVAPLPTMEQTRMECPVAKTV